MAESWFSEGVTGVSDAGSDDTIFDFGVEVSFEKDHSNESMTGEEKVKHGALDDETRQARESVGSRNGDKECSSGIEDIPQQDNLRSTKDCVSEPREAGENPGRLHPPVELLETKGDQQLHNSLHNYEGDNYPRSLYEQVDQEEEQVKSVDQEHFNQPIADSIVVSTSSSSGEREVVLRRMHEEWPNEGEAEAVDADASRGTSILTDDNVTNEEQLVEGRSFQITDYSRVTSCDSFSRFTDQSSRHHELHVSNISRVAAQDALLGQRVLSTGSADTESSIEVLKNEQADSSDHSEAEDKYNVTASVSNATEQSFSDISEYHTMPSNSSISRGSNTKTNDKYVMPGGVNIIVTQLRSSPVTSESRLLSAKDRDDDILITTGLSSGSKVTDKSIEVSLASGSESLKEAILTLGSESCDREAAEEGSLTHEALDTVISIEDDQELQSLGRGSSSCEGTCEGSVMDKRTRSFEGGTIGSSVLSSFEETAGTATSYGFDTAASSLLGSSYSNLSDDNLNLSFLNFGGCIIDACVEPEPQLSFAVDLRGIEKDREDRTPASVQSESRRGRFFSGVYQETPKHVKKKFEMLADYMNVEMPLQEHLASAKGEAQSRDPLSPRSNDGRNPHKNAAFSPRSNDGSNSRSIRHKGGSINSYSASDTKTPKHHNLKSSVSNESLPDHIPEDNGDNNSSEGTVESNRENRPTSLKSRTKNGSTSSAGVLADSLQSGKSWELRNKMLTGARRKMQIAMSHRHLQQRYHSSSRGALLVPPQELVTQNSLRSYSEQNLGVSSMIGEHEGTVSEASSAATSAAHALDGNRFSQNRWKKPGLNMAEYSKRKSRYRRHRRYLRAQHTSSTAAGTGAAGIAASAPATN